MKDLRAHTLAINDATYAAWNAHDPDAVAAVFAEDAEVREAGQAEPSRGQRSGPCGAGGRLIPDRA